MHINKVGVLALIFSVLMMIISTGYKTQSDVNQKIKVIFDTDANNELDDQHAMAYLFFNGDVFNVLGVTVNATYNGGDINEHYAEAKRIMQLCNVYEKVPLLKGANGSFEKIRESLKKKEFDGRSAVDFIIRQAHKAGKERLVLLPVGKLTNIALALQKDPSIAPKVRIVWLGSNFPEPGEYNQDNDTAALNFILKKEVPFEIVTVRYGNPTGTSAVTATRKEISEKMPGLGPKAITLVNGRHGGTFNNFGDYSVDLFKHIETYDEPGSRALFDMAAVAIVKNPTWAVKKSIPAPVLDENKWKAQPQNKRSITIWEQFDKQAIINDFYKTMKYPVLVLPIPPKGKSL